MARTLLMAVALVCAAPGAWAEARLAGLFGDHMVLQRDAPIRVWGWAAPGEAVRVEFRRSGRETAAAADGRWSVLLPAAPAGGPHELTVRARTNAVVLRDVLVGEVWVCSGQSNMEWPLQSARDAAQEIAAADDDGIRHLKVAHRASLHPLDDIEPAVWEPSRPASAGQFSAVAYFFARKLRRETGMPVGLINASWGGTPIETWLGPRAARRDPDLAPLLDSMPASEQDFATMYQARMEAIVQRWQPGWALPGDRPAAWTSEEGVDDRGWPELVVPRFWEVQGLAGFDGVVWYRRRVELSEAQAAGPATLHLGAIDDCDETWVNGQRVGGQCAWDASRDYALAPGTLHAGVNLIAVRVTDTGGDGGFRGEPGAVSLATGAGDVALAGAWKARVEAPLLKTQLGPNDLPTLLFNGMVKPLLPMRIRGVIWYQGETNVPRAARYAASFQSLIEDWRVQWGQGAFPFYFAQLTYRTPLEHNSFAGSAWAELRDAQGQALMLPHTGMAVTLDLGDPTTIHPTNKQDVGTRLALLALGDVHGRRVVSRGPRYRSTRIVGERLVVRFSSPGSELAVRGGGQELQGFAIADASRRFVAAQARLEGDRVRVWSDAVANPVAVRYAWFDNTAQADLVNRVGLPAAPFRTDHWPGLTDGEQFVP